MKTQILNSNPTGPFFWVDKGAAREIRSLFDSDDNVTSALMVYYALAEIASDVEARTFCTTHAWIAKQSGLSRRTILDRLQDLADAGFIHVEKPRLRGPATYTILDPRSRSARSLRLPAEARAALEKNEGASPVAQPLHNVAQPTVQPSLLPLEETLEESEKNPKKKDAALALDFPSNLSEPFRRVFLEEWIPYRKGLRKVGSWPALFQRQLRTLSAYGEVEAIQRLERAMTNGWSGFDFPLGPPRVTPPPAKNYFSL